MAGGNSCAPFGGHIGNEARRSWAEASPFLVLILAIAVSSTTGVGVGDSWFDEQRMIGIASLGVAAFLAALTRASWPSRSPVTVALLFLLAIGLLSSLMAQRPYLALLEWSVLALIASLVVGARMSNLRTICVIGALFGAIVATAYVTGVVANYISQLILGFPIGWQTLLVGFSNPRFPAHLEALSIPFLFLAWRLAPGRFWRVSTFVVAIAWWACLIGSGSRTAWLSLGLALGLVAWLERDKGFLLTRFHSICALLGGIAFAIFFLLLPALLDLTSTPEADRLSDLASVGRRAILWRHGFDAAIANPFLGVGPMHYAYSYNGEGAHPHNFWLQLAAEWGLPVAGVALTMVVLLWRRLTQLAASIRSTSEERETGLVLLAALTAWIVGTQADGFMVVPTSQLASAVILPLCAAFAAMTNRHRIEVTQPASTVQKMCWAVMMLIAFLMLASLAFSSFGKSGERERRWREGRENVYFHPRFWQQGWIGPDHDVTARQR